MAEYFKSAVRIDLLVLWLALCGVWPFAHTTHNPLDGPMSIIDIVVHVAAWFVLFSRWQIVRRTIRG